MRKAVGSTPTLSIFWRLIFLTEYQIKDSFVSFDFFYSLFCHEIRVTTRIFCGHSSLKNFHRLPSYNNTTYHNTINTIGLTYTVLIFQYHCRTFSRSSRSECTKIMERVFGTTSLRNFGQKSFVHYLLNHHSSAVWSKRFMRSFYRSTYRFKRKIVQHEGMTEHY